MPDEFSSRYRKLNKAKQSSASAAKLTGRPSNGEGQNGDIQIRMTDKGPRLFAKLGNKWLISELKDSETSQVEVKMHAFKGIMSAGATSHFIPIPAWIHRNRVTGIIFFANHSSNLFHVYNWADLTNDPEAGAYVTRHRVLYDRNSHAILIDRMGTQIDDGKPYKVIVFYT